jgi:sugar O-acyltransferase (sialic acid O-acetyltransferase NeuD family)
VEITTIILQGGGEHARVVLDSLVSSGKRVTALFDPKYTGSLMGVEQRGTYDAHFQPSARVIVAIGDNTLRRKVVGITTHAFATCVDRTALVSKHAAIGEGSMILQGAIVQAQTEVGNHVILNTGCQVDHDCNISDYVHIAPGAVLCGTVQVGEGTLVGAGAVILPGKKIGSWVTIGAGAVVIDDVPDYAVVVGNPGRIIKYNRP